MFNKEMIMKKIYMTPEMKAIEVKTISMLADSLPKNSAAVTNESAVLGRGGGDFDFDDDED